MQCTVCGRVRAVGAVAGRRAAVPAEVVELVADVRHRQLVDDLALLGIDDGEEVWLVDACALVQAGEVEVLLGRRLHRIVRCVVERRSVVGHRDLLRLDSLTSD
jgi:hypothetical protein